MSSLIDCNEALTDACVFLSFGCSLLESIYALISAITLLASGLIGPAIRLGGS